MNAFLDNIKEATATLEDQNEVQAGFEREVTPAGPTPARFIGYVELGKRKQRPYQGKEKPDAPMVRLTFELNGKKHRNSFEKDGVTQEFTNTISVTIAKKMSDKAVFWKLFKRMVAGRDGITHMAQMLGEGFMITVVHNEAEKDGKRVVYANIRDAEGTWTVGAPYMTVPDEDGEPVTKAVPVPEVTKPLQCLLWDNPSKEMWDSIFIDGTYTKKDGDKEVEVSKNWLQEDIVANATDFIGSPLEEIVAGLSELSLENDPVEAPEEAPAEKSAAPADDPLAAMGL